MEKTIGNLLEKILDRNNLNQAYKKAFRNKGIAGIDNIKVNDMLEYMKEEEIKLL